MEKSNKDIRSKIQEAGVYQWQVAKMYGLSESNFCRLFREELSKKEKAKVLHAISKAEEKYIRKKINGK